jgi:hypothetical protein
MTRCSALVAIALVAGAFGTAGAGEPTPLAAAQRAVRELRYEDAGAEIEGALRRGHFTRKELLAAYALRAEVASVVGGPVAGENAFRRLLLLEPEHPPPPRNTPIFTLPFARAQRWVAAHGSLAAEHTIAIAPRVGAPTPLTLAVSNDAFELVAGARLWVRAADETTFTAQPGGSLRPSLPPIRPGSAVDYYLELVDAGESVLVQIGSADDPFTLVGPAGRPPAPPAPVPTVSAPPPPRPAATPTLVSTAPPRATRHHPYRVAGGVLAALGVGALGAALGVDIDGRQQLDTLLSSCAPSCMQSDVDALHDREHTAIALYAVGGAVAVTSVVLFTIDLAKSHRR